MTEVNFPNFMWAVYIAILQTECFLDDSKVRRAQKQVSREQCTNCNFSDFPPLIIRQRLKKSFNGPYLCPCVTLNP